MLKVKLGVSKASDYTGGIGNTGILLGHVGYFEKKLEEEIAPYKEHDLPVHIECHNFAAWIRLYTEFICNKALSELHRAESCRKKIKKYKFKEAVNKIIEITEKEAVLKGISKSEFDNMKIAIKKVVELRHSIQHGGVPNILRETKFKDIEEIDIYKMTIPQNYKETKEILYSANELIELMPRPTLHIYDNGHPELEKDSGED